jgi:hypothetical protein
MRYWAGQPEFAGWIKKKKQVLAGSVVFPGLPQPAPLFHFENLTFVYPADCLIHSKLDRGRRQAARGTCIAVLNLQYRSRKDLT